MTDFFVSHGVTALESRDEMGAANRAQLSDLKDLDPV